MKIFYCKDRFEDMMTCLYDAWAAGIIEGHENIRVQKGPVYQQDLFTEYFFIEYDEEKTRKVIRSIQRKISWNAYVSVFYACHSCEEDAFQTVYEFLRLGFRVGGQVLQMQTVDCVMRMMEIRRRVGGEAHLFVEFARFTSLSNQIYLCQVEPKNHVLVMMAEHFADRMPSEHWIIMDKTRRCAIIHPKNEDFYMRYLTEEEFSLLERMYQKEDQFTALWKSFFEAISIRERENPKCQRNHFPLWMRKNATEFMK